MADFWCLLRNHIITSHQLWVNRSWVHTTTQSDWYISFLPNTRKAYSLLINPGVWLQGLKLHNCVFWYLDYLEYLLCTCIENTPVTAPTLQAVEIAVPAESHSSVGTDAAVWHAEQGSRSCWPSKHYEALGARMFYCAGVDWDCSIKHQKLSSFHLRFTPV